MAKRGAYTKFDDEYSKGKEHLEAFSKALRDAIKAKDITNADLAKKVGMKENSISQYRSGIQFPQNPDKLIRLADALDTTVDSLVGHKVNEKKLMENDDPSIGLLLGLSAESIKKIKMLSDSCSDTLDKLIRSDLFDEAISTLNEADSYINGKYHSISRRFAEKTIHTKDRITGEAVALPINEKRREADQFVAQEDEKLAFFAILAVREKITPLLRDALGFDRLEELTKGSANDGE